MNEYPESMNTEDALRMLVYAVDKLQFNMGGVDATKNCKDLLCKWDNREPTFYYLERNLKWAKFILERNLASKADNG